MRSFALVAFIVLALLAGCGDDKAENKAADQKPEAAQEASAKDNTPKLKIRADKTHAVQPGDIITLTIDVEGFALDESKKGRANEPNVGHYHVYLDDASGDDYLLTGAQPTTRVIVPGNITDGTHPLRVSLHNNDHSPVAPAVEQKVLLIVYKL